MASSENFRNEKKKIIFGVRHLMQMKTCTCRLPIPFYDLFFNLFQQINNRIRVIKWEERRKR